jgi:hypothetical protein
MQQPEVGIFFLVEDRLLVESVPLDEAVGYGDFKIVEGSHSNYWDKLLEAGQVAGEYDEWPRARVAFDARREIHFIGRPLHPRPAEDPGRHHQEATLARQPRDFD